MAHQESALIFVVCGDAHFCYMIRRYTRRSAHKILIEINDTELQNTIERENPDAIILEIEHINLSGWKTIRNIKSCPETKNIPVLVCSWQDNDERARSAGAAIHLRMPLLYQDFTNALEAVGLSNAT